MIKLTKIISSSSHVSDMEEWSRIAPLKITSSSSSSSSPSSFFLLPWTSTAWLHTSGTLRRPPWLPFLCTCTCSIIQSTKKSGSDGKLPIWSAIQVWPWGTAASSRSRQRLLSNWSITNLRWPLKPSDWMRNRVTLKSLDGWIVIPFVRIQNCVKWGEFYLTI